MLRNYDCIVSLNPNVLVDKDLKFYSKINEVFKDNVCKYKLSGVLKHYF